MNKSYQIAAYAKNTVFHRSASFVLDSDGKFSVDSRSDGREYRNEAAALAYFNDYATQAEANAFTAHTDVTFELIQSSMDEDGEIVEGTLMKSSFKVEGE